MAEASRTQAHEALRKLQQKASLSDQELASLQSYINVLEQRSRSHHDTTSHHHTSVFAEPEI